MAVRPLNYISLCTGGGGLDLGFELAVPAARPVVYVEREAFGCARLVSAIEAGLLAAAPVWSNVRTFRGRAWRGLVDFLIGGIPCQPHSLAGARLGRHDERDLWPDTRRIIVATRPWGVLIENVPGMLSAKRGEIPGALRVRRDLQRLGYIVEGGIFSAEEMGYTHQRERVFILGILERALPQVGLADSSIERWEGGRSTRDRSGQRPPVERGCREVAARSVALGDANCRRRRSRSGFGSTRHREAELGSDYADPSMDASHRVAQGDPKICHGEGAREFQAHHAATREWESRGPSGAVADADDAEGRGPDARQRPAGRTLAGGPSSRRLGPPGPDDASAWIELLRERPDLEPSVRRGADGLADRVDELYMLGNGVVPLAGGYAVRSLVHAIAGRGFEAAAQLVRMMGA